MANQTSGCSSLSCSLQLRAARPGPVPAQVVSSDLRKRQPTTCRLDIDPPPAGPTPPMGQSDRESNGRPKWPTWRSAGKLECSLGGAADWMDLSWWAIRQVARVAAAPAPSHLHTNKLDPLGSNPITVAEPTGRPDRASSS